MISGNPRRFFPSLLIIAIYSPRDIGKNRLECRHAKAPNRLPAGTHLSSAAIPGSKLGVRCNHPSCLHSSRLA